MNFGEEPPARDLMDPGKQQPMTTRDIAAFLAQFGAKTSRIVVQASGIDFDIRDVVYDKDDNVIRVEVGEYRG